MDKDPKKTEDEDDDEALSLEAQRALDDRLTYEEGDLVLVEEGTPPEAEDEAEDHTESLEEQGSKHYDE